MATRKALKAVSGCAASKCVFITAVAITKLFAWGEGDSVFYSLNNHYAIMLATRVSLSPPPSCSPRFSLSRSQTTCAHA